MLQWQELKLLLTHACQKKKKKKKREREREDALHKGAREVLCGYYILANASM
jgi:hypothetical protein